MNLLLENPVAIGAVGAVATTFAALVCFSRRSGKSAAALALVVILTLVLLTVERLIETDREQIEAALHDTMAAIKANDVETVLVQIAPQAVIVRTDAETALPLVQVKAAGASQIETRLSEAAEKRTATTHFRGLVNGTSKKGGAPFGYFDEVDVTWTKQGERWLIDGYTIYLKGKPINAVQRVQSSN